MIEPSNVLQHADYFVLNNVGLLTHMHIPKNRAHRVHGRPQGGR